MCARDSAFPPVSPIGDARVHLERPLGVVLCMACLALQGVAWLGEASEEKVAVSAVLS